MNGLITGLILLLGAVLPFLGVQESEAEKPLPTATIVMESGEEIHLELYPDIAPNTVANFISLAQSGFYDGLTFHRAVPLFMIQGGCPNGDGSGGPGYTIEGEFSFNGFDNPLSHERGVISMARQGTGLDLKGRNTGFDTAGSQFFIMHRNGAYLNKQYAAFGKVTDEASMAVVDRIAMSPTDSDSKPLTEERIRTIIVETHGVTYTPEIIPE